MLSAHAPYETYPATLKQAVMRAGGLAQFAGGVPAMCDGITQGRNGMQLSLFSRDVIAMSTAISLSHDMFDAADRKSTRLNSSHANISYAVFCLKKKKK